VVLDVRKEVMRVQKRLGKAERSGKSSGEDVKIEKFRAIPQNEVHFTPSEDLH